jgi:DNA-binding NarL/FixJ family response regulator
MHAVKTYIVEDSPVILEHLVAALHELTPVQVVGSSDSEDSAVAWLLAPGNDCDLIVVDLFLRAGSGLGVLSAATRAGVAARRVVLTNYASLDMRQRCLALGAHRVFDKSNEVDEMLAYCTSLGEEDASPTPAH